MCGGFGGGEMKKSFFVLGNVRCGLCVLIGVGWLKYIFNCLFMIVLLFYIEWIVMVVLVL